MAALRGVRPGRHAGRRSAGEDVVLDDHELDQVEAALDGLGDAVYSGGICAPPVPVGDDAARQVRVLASTGRRS